MTKRLLYDRRIPSSLAGKLLKVAGLKPVDAEHTFEEGLLLKECARDRGVIVELGVAEGASACEMRQVMSPTARLYLIDPYAGSQIPWVRVQELIARRCVASSSRGTVTFVRDYSARVLSRWREPIDLIFVDADHRYASVRADWDGWTTHLAEDGLVALHDAKVCAKRGIGPTDGPVQLCEELRSDGSWSVVAEVDSLVVFERQPKPMGRI